MVCCSLCLQSLHSIIDREVNGHESWLMMLWNKQTYLLLMIEIKRNYLSIAFLIFSFLEVPLI